MASHLTHFDPFRDLASIDSLRNIDDFFRDMGFKHALKDFVRPSQIRINVTESDQAYRVKAVLPGFKLEEISVDIDGNRVSISAETKQESSETKQEGSETEGETMLRRERYVGQYFRSFSLGQDIDDAKSVAKYRDGVLELTLPKRKNSAVKKLIIGS